MIKPNFWEWEVAPDYVNLHNNSYNVLSMLLSNHFQILPHLMHDNTFKHSLMITTLLYLNLSAHLATKMLLTTLIPIPMGRGLCLQINVGD